MLLADAAGITSATFTSPVTLLSCDMSGSKTRSVRTAARKSPQVWSRYAVSGNVKFQARQSDDPSTFSNVISSPLAFSC